jgi:hypothetical protein
MVLRFPSLTTLSLALSVVAASGCGLGSGTGTVTGAIFAESCTATDARGSAAAPAAFDLRPGFFVADMVRDMPKPDPQNRLAVRIQSGGNYFEEADALFFSVVDSGEVAAALGQPISVGPTTNLRATLSLRQTCPRIPSRLELDGQITFSSFGKAQGGVAPANDFIIEYGDTLAATFDFTIVDRRAITLGGTGGVPTEPTVGGQLSGEFSFVVRPGRAAQAYP